MVTFDVFAEGLLTESQARSMNPAQKRASERMGTAASQTRFDEELLKWKAMIEASR